MHLETVGNVSSLYGQTVTGYKCWSAGTRECFTHHLDASPGNWDNNSGGLRDKTLPFWAAVLADVTASTAADLVYRCTMSKQSELIQIYVYRCTMSKQSGPTVLGGCVSGCDSLLGGGVALECRAEVHPRQVGKTTHSVPVHESS